MILLKANDKLKAVFQKIIKTMGENVEWTDIFLINNNDLILLGRVRSLFFNFDNKRAYSNIIDITVNEESIEQITDNELLENTLNMTLYTFGKWRVIKGLRVEKDYDQLNKLLHFIFQDIHVDASLTKDNLRFYMDGVQMTYEEIIQFILNWKKSLEHKEDETKEEVLTEEEEDSDYSLGLWHKMVWKSTKLSFVKEEITESDKVKSRLGNDFYMVNYRCPSCSEKLYMVVYPMGKEFRIETDEGGVYLARAYTCNSCKSFYTPKPQTLLGEGEVYWLTFEDDSIAYEDYQELLGKQGRKTSNCNFNEYEEHYINKNNKEASSLEELCDDCESMSDEEIEELKDKMDSGFYPEEDIHNYIDLVEQERSSRKLSKKIEKQEKEKSPDSRIESDKKADQEKKVFLKEEKEDKLVKKVNHKEKNSDDKEKSNQFKESERVIQQEEVNRQNAAEENKAKSNNAERNLFQLPTVNLREIVTSLFKGDSHIFNEAVKDLSKEQLGELKLMIQSEQNLEENARKNSIDRIDRYLYKDKEKEVLERTVSCKGKSYEHILSVINDIKKEEISEDVKTSILSSLRQLLEKTGKKELEHLTSQIPENINKKQYEQFKNKIEDYKEVDRRLFDKILDEKRDDAEKQEIATFMKRANPRNRKTYLETYNKLKEQSFEERNVAPVLEKIYNKVYDMDAAAIGRICKEPADLTFEQGLKAYDEILLGDYLPDLKEDMISQIDKRLTKLKVDECDQLVHKLVKEISSFIKEDSRIYFYQARKMMRQNIEDANSIIIHNALKSYAKGRGKYEYPILICDTSYARNGESGFILTPNHIFYRSLLESGVINVMDIEEIYARTGLISKGIYVNDNTEKVKISNSLQSSELKAIAKALDDFVSYLKEKPESRNISYMAKELHKVKCCYRCGYVYSEGSVCPKCGSKMNE